MDKPKRILVLGANGFIGSHLVDNLAGSGFEVKAFDRFSAEPQFAAGQNITIVRGDIFDKNSLTTALEDVDFVVHCFSATTPYSADLDPYMDIGKNLLNNVKLFELCAKQRIKKLVYISSGGTVYGASAENGKSAKETDVALPVSPYGIAKLATERYLEYFQKKYGMQHVSYRLSNPYGPRQITKHNQGVIPRFIKSIKAGQAITLYGDGSSSRDYIYIEDAARLIASSFEAAKQTVYNLGSGRQTSLSNLIEILEELLGTTAIVEKLPEPESFSHTAQLDVSRFHEEFKLTPEVDLRAGLSRTIESLST